MTWATPLAFLLVLPWSLAAWRLFRSGRRRAVAFSALGRLPQRTTWRQRLRGLSPLLLLSGLGALILAAARPQTRTVLSRRSADIVAINMVMDVSGSMDALDFSVQKGGEWDLKTRLDVVKEVFADFVERRPDDLVGLVTFGGFATTRSPLTLDHQALRHVLGSVKIPRQEDGTADREELMTAVGDGLAMGCARLDQATNVISKVIVLLSDGESNAGVVTPDEATRLAKKLGIKVYCIGVGTTGVAPVRGRDLFGREVIGQMNVTMDEEALRKIARETGGLYFGVLDRKGLDQALGQIDALEKTRVDQTVYEDRHEHFLPWLLSGLLLVSMAFALNMAVERRLA